MPKISILTHGSARCFFVQICILIYIQIQCIVILTDIEFDIDNPQNHFGSTDVVFHFPLCTLHLPCPPALITQSPPTPSLSHSTHSHIAISLMLNASGRHVAAFALLLLPCCFRAASVEPKWFRGLSISNSMSTRIIIH